MQGSSLHNEYLKFNHQYGTAPAGGRWLRALLEISLAFKKRFSRETSGKGRGAGKSWNSNWWHAPFFWHIITVSFLHNFRGIGCWMTQISPYLKTITDLYCSARNSLSTWFIIPEITCFSCKFLNDLVCNVAAHPEYYLCIKLQNYNRYLFINLAGLKFNLTRILVFKSPLTEDPCSLSPILLTLWDLLIIGLLNKEKVFLLASSRTLVVKITKMCEQPWESIEGCGNS